MASKTFAEILKSSLDVGAIDRFFVEDQTGKTLEVLQKLRPEGRVDGGRFKLASIEGGAGGSTDYNLQNHQWGDWGNGGSKRGRGLVAFVQATMNCRPAQAVNFLIQEKFLVAKDAKKALADADGDPLVLPIPEEKRAWEVVLDSDALRKDRGLITHHWQYLDVDGSLLGYKYRVDRGTSKEVLPVTFRAQSGWTKKAWQKKLAPLYGLHKLGTGPNVRVLVVEGEKTADAAQEILGNRWKVIAFSGVSASQQVWIPDEKFLDGCEFVLWPDHDNAGRDAMRHFQLALEKLQNKPSEIRWVRTESIAGLTPGWDLADWEEGCGVDVRVELERAEAVDSFERISREYVYVTRTDQFYNLVDRYLVFSPSAFDRRFTYYSDKTGSASKKFLANPETVKIDDLEFVPGDEEFITSAQGKSFLNEWLPSPVLLAGRRIARDTSITDDAIADKAQNFTQHVLRIADGAVAEPDLDPDSGLPVPGTEARPISDALYTYFSALVKRPMDKSGWVPTLLSQHNGTGKSYFLTLMQAILGGEHTVVVRPHQYVGQYDDWRDKTLFYELAEVKIQDDTTSIYDEIKKNHNYRPYSFGGSVDRQANAVKLNIKTRGMKVQRDFLNGMVTSNNLFPLVLGTGGDSGSDRRLLVVRCEHRLTDPEALALYGELETHAEWVCAWLLRFKPAFKWSMGWAPVTEHKRQMFEKDRERSETRADKYELGKYDEFYHFVKHAMREKIGGFARAVITGQNIRDIAQLAERGLRAPYDENRFNKILLRAGLHPGPMLELDGNPRRCYAKDPEWLEKPDKEWRTELARSINGGI